MFMLFHMKWHICLLHKRHWPCLYGHVRQIWAMLFFQNAMFTLWTHFWLLNWPFCVTDDFVALWMSACCQLDLWSLWMIGRGLCRVPQKQQNCWPYTSIKKSLRALKLNKIRSSNISHNFFSFMMCKTILRPVSLWEIRLISITGSFLYFHNHLKQLVLRTSWQSLRAGYPSLLVLHTSLELFLTLCFWEPWAMYRHNAFSRHARNVMRVAGFSFPWSLRRFMCQYNENEWLAVVHWQGPCGSVCEQEVLGVDNLCALGFVLNR